MTLDCSPEDEQERREQQLEQGIAAGDMPSGLAVLSVQFEITFTQAQAWVSVGGHPLGDFDDAFRHFGATKTFQKGTTCFGAIPPKTFAMRFDVIGANDVLESLQDRLEIRLKRTHTHFFPNLKHFCDEQRGDWFHACFKDVAVAASFDETVRAGALSNNDANRLLDLIELTNGDLSAMALAIRRVEKRRPEASFLVPGLIPDGSPTLLLGNKKTGKSTAMLELAVAVARREKEWLGFPLNNDRRGFAVYMAGEDSEATVAERVQRMTGGETPLGLHVIPAKGNDLDATLEQLSKENVRALFIDPARKYYTGDEDGSEAVSGFFNRVEPICQQKNCALVVAHHLKRNAAPRSVADVADSVRGSGVWLDRPRVTLGMIRSGEETHVGISWSGGSPLHNFRADQMFKGVQRLRRDDATSRHIPIARAATKVAANDDITRVLAAVLRLTAAGERVTRTGASGLYERGADELKGLSRMKVRSALNVLIQDGSLRADDSNALSASDASNTTERDMAFLD